MQNYEVAIVGGGPVGLALGIELGLQGIKTIIYEKHASPQMHPRAQLLNPRTMEFFRRWGISRELINKKLLPDDYPLKNIWCSGLNGKVYSSVDISEHINHQISPENYLRIPLWITEEVLLRRIANFPNVDFIKNHEVTALIQNDDDISLKIKNRETDQTMQATAKYVVGCDGSRSITRKLTGIPIEENLSPQQVLNVVFSSQQLKEKMTVPKGILYYNLTLAKPAAFGCIDYNNGLWYAQLVSSGNEELENMDVSGMLDQVAGFQFNKEVILANFWLREAQIVTHYRQGNIFLAGDAAHIFPPTGGHGLNTGFGDAVNLAWKLAAKIKNQAADILLESYEIERRPIALRNIQAAKKNALDAGELRQKYPPEKFPMEFAAANAELAKQHTVSLGIALGYCYQNSPFIINSSKNYNPHNWHNYDSLAEPGFFAPHCQLANGKSIYDSFKPCHILLSSLKVDRIISEIFLKKGFSLQILHFSDQEFKQKYSQNFYLLRPDWHIAWVGNDLADLLVAIYQTQSYHYEKENYPTLCCE